MRKCSPPIPLKSGSWRGQVYQRFADGDSTQFFTQLLLVLDVYARYVERIPKAAVQANQDSFAILQDTREEIAMIAKTIEARDVNITNHAAKTDELCKITQAKCDETVASIELMSEKSRFASGHQSHREGNRRWQ